MQWFFLSVAIVSEVVATSALKASNGFTQFWPSIVVGAGYAVAFFFLSLALRTLSVGIAYAICWRRHRAHIACRLALSRTNARAPAILGLALIVAGVVILNVFSRSTVH
ncbi:small multidrug resistance pump [Nitrosospira multiformis]|uniref:Small multidrug resistance pump n=1 Tax=Nitrosospira multiformis TaxID=1231 RepID=A0A1I7F6N4_9PROT|nr:small multidrug resistance pump [Nitrosospira multiformis]